MTSNAQRAKEAFGSRLREIGQDAGLPGGSSRSAPAFTSRRSLGRLGAHAQTAFWIFDQDLVKVETLTAALDITRPDEIEIYVTVFDQMQRAAKFGRNAKALILKARDELLDDTKPTA